MISRADSLTHEDLQKAREKAVGDIVEKLHNIDNISGDIEESEVERISIIGDEAAAEIERLRADLESECERRDEIIASTTKLWKDAEAALAEAKEAMRQVSQFRGQVGLMNIEENGNLATVVAIAEAWLEKHK